MGHKYTKDGQLVERDLAINPSRLSDLCSPIYRRDSTIEQKQVSRFGVHLLLSPASWKQILLILSSHLAKSKRRIFG
jgi:hypothetical protein